MNILNQKEEVLKVELTKHGRKLLGMGIYQPKYFSFFDDTIIYDSSYYGQIEDTNYTKDRILDESITISAPNLLALSLENELGSSNTINDYAPAWNLNFINGKILSLDESSTYYRKIFNLEDITYDIVLKDNTQNPSILEDYILIDLQELNVDDDLQNYEIEVVTFDELQGGKGSGLEKRLKFQARNTNIIDGFIYDSDELPYNFFNVDIEVDDVSYFLDVLVDDEIDTDFIISKDKKVQQTIRTAYTSTETPDPCEPCCDTPGTEIC